MAVAWVKTQLTANIVGNNTTTISYPIVGGFTAGNSLCGGFFYETSHVLSSVTDDATPANTYTIFDVITDPIVNTDFFASWGLTNIKNIPTNIIFTFTTAYNNSTNTYAVADEISGASTINAHNGNSAATSTHPNSGNLTTTLDGCLFWAACAPDSATTVTAGTNLSFTLRVNNDAVTGMSTETGLQTTHGTQSADFNFNPTSASPIIALAFAPPVITTGQLYIPQVPVRQRFRTFQSADEQWPFTATPNPLKMQGIYYDPQFPLRQRQDPRQARGDEQWPFTAVPTPGQFGWEWRPEFARARFRPMRASDEQWPFTSVVTPQQFGWDNPERFSQRVRFRPSRSADEQWPFTAVPTPGPLGWQIQDPFPLRARFRPSFQAVETPSPQATQTPSSLEWAWDPQFPLRLRFRTFQSADEQWAFTAVVTPGQFGWDNPERFPLRARFRTFQQADEQWPFTAIGTPAQFGWQLDPQFAIRRRFRTFQSSDDQWIFTSVPTPAAFGFDWNPQFPFRVRYRPLTINDEQWSFTATPTPTQFGWHLEPQVPVRGRFRPQLAQFDVTTFIPGTLTPTNIDFAYPPESLPVRTRFRPLVYEPFNPQPPPISPTFQTVIANATKLKASTGATYITITLQGTGAFVFTPTAVPTILAEGLPFASAHVVLTSGSTPVSVALAVSNDGLNFVQIGPSATNFPTLLNISASPSVLTGKLPYKFHAWIVTGGDATTLLTITELLVGWRG